MTKQKKSKKSSNNNSKPKVSSQFALIQKLFKNVKFLGETNATNTRQLNDWTTCDIFVVVPSSESVFGCHKSVLLKNPFFQSFQNFKEWDDQIIIINEDYSRELVAFCLMYLYCGANGEKMEYFGQKTKGIFIKENFIGILTVADYFQLDELSKDCFSLFPGIWEFVINQENFTSEYVNQQYLKSIFESFNEDVFQNLEIILAWSRNISPHGEDHKTIYLLVEKYLGCFYPGSFSFTAMKVPKKENLVKLENLRQKFGQKSLEVVVNGVFLAKLLSEEPLSTKFKELCPVTEGLVRLASKKYTWRIEDWKEKAKKDDFASPVFGSGGESWYLQFITNSELEHFSLYLYKKKNLENAELEDYCVMFTFVCKSIRLSSYTGYRFKNDGNGLGYSKFIKKSEISNFVKDNVLEVNCYMHIFKDETGELFKSVE